MIRRPRRGIPATLTALAALIVCALAATVAIQLIGGRPPLISYTAMAAELHRARWRDLVVAIVAGVVALVGLVLVLTALIPGRAIVLPLGADEVGDADLVAGVSRRSFALTLRAAAGSAEGVSRAKLVLRRRMIRVVARADRVDDSGIADAISVAVNARIDQLAPTIRPEVRVRVHPARRTNP